MKILLINPPYRRLMGIGSAYFPIGLGYIASVLEQAGYQVKIYNGEVPRSDDEQKRKHKGGDFNHIMMAHENYLKNLDNDDFFVWQEFKKSFDEFQPDAVGITARTPMLKSAMKVARLVKIWNKDCKIIWGGSHPTIAPDEIMALPEADFIVYGEGEETAVELINALQNKINDYSQIKGVYYKNASGEIMKNSAREYIGDLDILPMPGRHLVFSEDLYVSGVYADLMGSRGCPFLCTYCSAQSLWGKQVRYRSVDNIIEELKVLKNKYNCEYIRFIDDNLMLKREWIEKLCEKIVAENLNIKWGCLGRANLIDEKLLKLMIRAGCYRVDIGVESGSPRVLKEMKKNIDLADVLKVDQLFDKYGIDWTAFFIVGFPYETMDDLKTTASFMNKINPYRLVLSSFTPYPATEDYERTKEMGMLPDLIDWGLFDHNSPNNFFMKYVNHEEYRKFFIELSDWVSLRNTHRIRGRESYYLRHPASLLRKGVKFIRKRI